MLTFTAKILSVHHPKSFGKSLFHQNKQNYSTVKKLMLVMKNQADWLVHTSEGLENTSVLTILSKNLIGCLVKQRLLFY